MQLGEARNRLTAAVRKMGKSYGPEEMDMAIQMALNFADLSSYHSLSLTSALTMTVNNPETSLSTLTGFRPDRVIRAQLAFTDEGVWATATAYQVGDLVTGDGTPDAYFWACTEAHTSSASNEPGTDGGAAYWERRLWKRGDVIEIVDLNTIAHMLGDRPLLRNYLPDDFLFPNMIDSNVSGQPRFGSFLTQSIFVCFPPPDAAYKFVFVMKSAVTDWVPGTEANVEIDVPDNVLMPLIWFGAAYFLDTTAKDAAARKEAFDRHVQNIDGNTAPQGAGIGYKDSLAYRDISDGPGWFGQWPYGM